MHDRIELINHIIRRRGYSRYLEIGCETDYCFRQIDCLVKVGVDPKSGGTVMATSDQYFAASTAKHDLIFIDGDHRCEQVLRDVLNALDHLTPEGTIVMHDCLPTTLEMTQPVNRDRFLAAGQAWTGDAWRVVASMARHPKLDVAVLNADWGVGVMIPRGNPVPEQALGKVPSIRKWTWEQFTEIPLFRIVGWEEMLRWIK